MSEISTKVVSKPRALPIASEVETQKNAPSSSLATMLGTLLILALMAAGAGLLYMAFEIPGAF